MGENNSEKFILEFSNHKRPHLTKGNHVKNNDKRTVALLLGELVDFEAIAERFVGSDVWTFFDSKIATGAGGIVVAVVALAMPLLLVRFMYQRKIFLRL